MAVVLVTGRPASQPDRPGAGRPGWGCHMGKIVSLTRNFEFLKAYNKGHSAVHPLVVTYVVKARGRGRGNRLGITASKKIGGAVQRNRARRVLREAYRQLAGELPPGHDIVLVARTKTVHCKSTQLVGVLKGHFRKLMGPPPQP